MNRKEILEFIHQNQNEKLLDFYNKSYEKLKEINRRLDKLTLYLIVIVFVYFILSESSTPKFQIGPLEISDSGTIYKILPVVFGYLLLELVVTSNHRAELFLVVKFLFLSFYKQEVNSKQLDGTSNNYFTRIVMPFGLSTELLKYASSDRSIANGCISVMLVLPFFSMVFLPFYFEYHLLKILYSKFLTDFFAKACFGLSIYTMAYLLYVLINQFILSWRSQKQERTDAANISF